MASQLREESPPLCSVVICTRERPAELEQCLAAVSRQDYPRFFTVVVDNASRDHHAQEIAARYDARYVAEPIPGLSRARNRGAAAFDSEIVAYLDDDCLPAPDWLSNLVEGFRDPSVIVVTGRVCAPQTNPDGAVRQWLVRRYEFGGPAPFVIDSGTAGWFELVNYHGVGIGGNMAFRRRAFEVWKGFDTRLGRGTPLIKGGAETYAFNSLVARGYKLLYTPCAVVRHDPSQASEQDLWARFLADLRAHTAYTTLLFFEEPHYRKEILAYKWKSLMQRFRSSHAEDKRPVGSGPGSVRMLLARLSGPWLYMAFRLRNLP